MNQKCIYICVSMFVCVHSLLIHFSNTGCSTERSAYFQSLTTSNTFSAGLPISHRLVACWMCVCVYVCDTTSDVQLFELFFFLSLSRYMQTHGSANFHVFMVTSTVQQTIMRLDETCFIICFMLRGDLVVVMSCYFY